jgi:hypothetical protein
MTTFRLWTPEDAAPSEDFLRRAPFGTEILGIAVEEKVQGQSSDAFKALWILDSSAAKVEAMIALSLDREYWLAGRPPLLILQKFLEQHSSEALGVHCEGSVYAELCTTFGKKAETEDSWQGDGQLQALLECDVEELPEAETSSPQVKEITRDQATESLGRLGPLTAGGSRLWALSGQDKRIQALLAPAALGIKAAFFHPSHFRCEKTRDAESALALLLPVVARSLGVKRVFAATRPPEDVAFQTGAEEAGLSLRTESRFFRF